MIDKFHDNSSGPIGIAAILSPAWLPTNLAPWLSIALQVGGLILIAVQIRYWWKKSG